MDIIVDPNTQHVVTVTPGRPLGEMDRAVAVCSKCGVICSGNAKVVIQIAVEHA